MDLVGGDLEGGARVGLGWAGLRGCGCFHVLDRFTYGCDRLRCGDLWKARSCDLIPWR
jgi:hypothetical protein